MNFETDEKQEPPVGSKMNDFEDHRKVLLRSYNRSLKAAIVLQILHLPFLLVEILLFLNSFFPSDTEFYSTLFRILDIPAFILFAYNFLFYLFSSIYWGIVIIEIFLVLFFLFRTGDWKAALQIEKRRNILLLSLLFCNLFAVIQSYPFYQNTSWM